MLDHACGTECIAWAIQMLENGYDSHTLRILAGLTTPLNHFEICALRDRVLEELQPPELAIEDPVSAHVAELVFEAIRDPSAVQKVFARVAQVAIELDYPDNLMPFYKLHFAADDLLHAEEQWYWDGATRENIDEIMLQEAQRFVAQFNS
ncbi:MAG TPA: hypothetical protein VFN10_03655 [Thermoanaerobaculia bacterium]|nr:hypothetical protein [Thermoanaerobaculia bacterium]